MKQPEKHPAWSCRTLFGVKRWWNSGEAVVGAERDQCRWGICIASHRGEFAAFQAAVNWDLDRGSKIPVSLVFVFLSSPSSAPIGGPVALFLDYYCVYKVLNRRRWIPDLCIRGWRGGENCGLERVTTMQDLPGITSDGDFAAFWLWWIRDRSGRWRICLTLSDGEFKIYDLRANSPLNSSFSKFSSDDSHEFPGEWSFRLLLQLLPHCFTAIESPLHAASSCRTWQGKEVNVSSPPITRYTTLKTKRRLAKMPADMFRNLSYYYAYSYPRCDHASGLLVFSAKSESA